MGLLPLIQFLRDVTAAHAWTPPPARAAFIVDDPNLHWRSYGHLNYVDLIRHARAFRYHVVMAMVPLDAWFAHPRVVRIFRDSTDVLSLCFHGNDHRRHDLEQPSTRNEALKTLSTAILRIMAFERRTGLDVSRVMVPPHEACSAATMAAMVELGFEAACATRPYLWLDFGMPPSPYNSPWEDDVLCGWNVAELMRNGFPVMLRRDFRELDEIILRSFFDQPILLYGHTQDFARGLHPFEQASTVINSLPNVAWKSLSAIAETNFETRREGTELRLRSFSRRVKLTVERDISTIVLEVPLGIGGFDHGLQVTLEDGDPAFVDGDVVILPAHRTGAVAVEIRWKPKQEVVPASVGRQRSSMRVVMRRIFAEARDRLQPLTPN